MLSMSPLKAFPSSARHEEAERLFRGRAIMETAQLNLTLVLHSIRLNPCSDPTVWWVFPKTGACRDIETGTPRTF
jgi:hypothetical protein